MDSGVVMIGLAWLGIALTLWQLLAESRERQRDRKASADRDQRLSELYARPSTPESSIPPASAAAESTAQSRAAA